MWQDTVKRQEFVLQELVQLKREGFLQQPQRMYKKIVNIKDAFLLSLHLSYSHLQFLLRIALLIAHLKVIIT